MLPKSVINTGTEFVNPEDQEASTFDIKMCRSKSISSANRKKKRQNQDSSEMNESFVTYFSVTKISLKTVDSIKGTTVQGNDNFLKKLRSHQTLKRK